MKFHAPSAAPERAAGAIPRISVIIPAFNEAGSIALVLDGLPPGRC